MTRVRLRRLRRRNSGFLNVFVGRSGTVGGRRGTCSIYERGAAAQQESSEQIGKTKESNGRGESGSVGRVVAANWGCRHR